MILPIYAYGQPVLKKVAAEIDKDYPEIDDLIKNMWETMDNASGVGLAAPQIGKSIRLFLIDSTGFGDEEGIRKVFINAHKIEEAGDEWSYEEGCLSIPKINGDVIRPEKIKLAYLDEDFNEHEEEFSGMTARVIQHEYDHIDGILFTELLSPLRRKLVRRKLEGIKKGKVKKDYNMKFV